MIERRKLLLATLVLPLFGRTAGAATMSSTTAYAFSFNGLDGGIIPLAEHAGRPIMVVNTASQCGYTPQYAGLQELWARFSGRGFFLLGAPSNDFGGQEPGGAHEIEATAKGEYHVTFPLTQKVAVNGPDAHPFYRWAALERPAERPRWNFHKYLVGRDGRIKAAFASAVEPTEPRIIAAIESELATS
ncbi:MAG TPA: glutathione peroxidase [Pseudolabrys sp.]|nr:glutathione peroxidase [Pseudolabrys sp.]